MLQIGVNICEEGMDDVAVTLIPRGIGEIAKQAEETIETLRRAEAKGLHLVTTRTVPRDPLCHLLWNEGYPNTAHVIDEGEIHVDLIERLGGVKSSRDLEEVEAYVKETYLKDETLWQRFKRWMVEPPMGHLDKTEAINERYTSPDNTDF